MRLLLYIILLIALAPGCGKSDGSSSSSADKLSGRWNMVRLQDKNTVLETIEPPAGYEGKVYIEFSGNSFSGKTMKNTISDGVYSLNGSDSITFGTFVMTKVAENQWGSAFVTMLFACSLQSVHPCRPSKITWINPKKIEINTPLRYIITLEKN